MAIELPRINLQHVEVTLIGDSPLICHRWSEKAKKAILDKQMKKASKGKVAKDPEQDFLDSLYPHPDGGYGFPAVAFKAAAVDACSQIGGITKVQARASFHVMCEMVKIEGSEPTPREDMVRIAMGTSDIRYRGQFENWRVTLPIRYNPDLLSIEQICNLFTYAGFGVGVGEWRPQKNGNYGMFHVATSDEVAA